MDNYFVIGKIVNTQGIKGDVRVVPSTDDVGRFELLKTILVEKKGTLTEYEVQNVRYHKQFVLLKLKGIDDMTSAEALKNTVVKIREKDSIPCEKDEYYIRDLYDMVVVEDNGNKLGVLKDIIFTGANDVYVVVDDDSEILIPAIKDCILKVDVENNTMTVKLLEGLI